MYNRKIYSIASKVDNLFLRIGDKLLILFFEIL